MKYAKCNTKEISHIFMAKYQVLKSETGQIPVEAIP